MIRSAFNPMTSRGARRWFVASVAVAAFLAMGAMSAQAAAVQFGTFSQTTGTPFTFNNQGGFASMNFSASAQTKFNFTAATGLSTADRDATLIMSGTTNAAVQSFGGFLIQPINGAVNTVTLIENSTGKTLLSMVFTGSIVGQSGSANGSLSGDTVNANTVAYTSDYLAFSGNPASFLIGLPTVTPALGITGNFLTSFVSNAQGSFSGSFTAIPAPTSVAMFGTGIVATLVLARRNRKQLANLKRA